MNDIAEHWQLILLFIAGIWAGAQNALAGGGSFITLPALMLTGLTPLSANITSTVALFPAQIASGYAGRSLISGAGQLPFKALFIISLIGGALGALLLLSTPSKIFSQLVPWLVLFATTMFIWGNFFKKTTSVQERQANPTLTGAIQLIISVYGGYFGGGIGFLMLAALTFAGLSARYAASTKNVLAAVMNASAVAIFIFSPQVGWLQMLILTIGATIGGWYGALVLKKVNDKILRIVIAGIGIILTLGLFFAKT